MRYALLIRLAIPLFVLFAWWRGRREPAWRMHWSWRWGKQARIQGRPLWIHAASLGEVNSAQSLLREIQARWPDLPLLLTAFTPTGLERLQELAPDASCRLLPLDLPLFWRRFFSAVEPRGLVVLETECWPNLLRACHQRQIPVVWLSGRLGDSSVNGMPRVFGRARLVDELAQVQAFAVQTELDAARFQALGAPRDRIGVVGSLKQDVQLAPDLLTTAEAWRREHGRTLCWLAASTHPGEDEKILAAHQLLLKKQPQALLLLAPRHPRRAEGLRQLITASGLTCTSRSQTAQPGDAQVYLIDSLGELMLFYATSDFCFVGGSLVDIGGHNLLEPARVGRAMITGPYLASCRHDADALKQVGGLRIVENDQQLQRALETYAEDAQLRMSAGQAALAYAESLGGALEKSLQLLERAMELSASD